MEEKLKGLFIKKVGEALIMGNINFNNLINNLINGIANFNDFDNYEIRLINNT